MSRLPAKGASKFEGDFQEMCKAVDEGKISDDSFLNYLDLYNTGRSMGLWGKKDVIQISNVSRGGISLEEVKLLIGRAMTKSSIDLIQKAHNNGQISPEKYYTAKRKYDQLIKSNLFNDEFIDDQKRKYGWKDVVSLSQKVLDTSFDSVKKAHVNGKIDNDTFVEYSNKYKGIRKSLLYQ